MGLSRCFAAHLFGALIGGVVVAPVTFELILPIAVAVQNRIIVNELTQTLAVYPSVIWLDHQGRAPANGT